MKGMASVLRSLLLFGVITLVSSGFQEELLLKPLPNGYHYSHFRFTNTLPSPGPDSFVHYELFPKTLGDVVSETGVVELHVRLTQGTWTHRLWGYPVSDAPAGAQLWAWFAESTDSVDARWQRLTHALSGLLCASLNFIDSSNTMQPEMFFRPEGAVPPSVSRNSSLLRYATLPREVVCTENLTPWKKLLPCGVKSGIAALLNAAALYNSHYSSLGVHVKRVCSSQPCLNPDIELTQTLDYVVEIPRSCGDLRDWSLRKLFNEALSSHCVLAESSLVYVDVTHRQDEDFSLQPTPSYYIKRNLSDVNSPRDYAVYDLKKLIAPETSPISIFANYKQPFEYRDVGQPVLWASRYLTGYGREEGGLMCEIHSNSDEPITLAYFDSIPWFATIYLHTLKIKTGDQEIQPSKWHIVPGKGKSRPAHFEVVFTVPAHSVTRVMLTFTHNFVFWSYHPPDANHGFYIGSAVLMAVVDTDKNSSFYPGVRPSIPNQRHFLRIYTEILLLSMPVPDFSMPYNVICLVCTVVALAFGPIHNVTTKRLVIVSPHEADTGILSKLKRILALLPGIKQIIAWRKKKSTKID